MNWQMLLILSLSVLSSCERREPPQLVVRAAARVQPLVILTKNLPPMEVGLAYAAVIKATGGQPPYLWWVSVGALPPGLTLTQSDNDGLISGTPTQAGNFNFTLTVKDRANRRALLGYGSKRI